MERLKKQLEILKKGLVEDIAELERLVISTAQNEYQTKENKVWKTKTDKKDCIDRCDIFGLDCRKLTAAALR